MIEMAAATTPISTYRTYLMYKASANAEYTKLCDIKSFPDMGGEPERIDVTTLSDGQRKYIQGVQDISSSTFSANYIAADLAKINALSGQQTEFALWFGASGALGSEVPTGENGQYTWTGDIMAYVNGGDVNSAIEMTIVTFPSTPFVHSLPGASGATGET
jgi:hypothetical protein